MRMLREDIEAASFEVDDVSPTPTVSAPRVAVKIPVPNPSPDAPAELVVKAEVIDGFLNLFPDRSYRHKDLAKAIGRA